MAPSMVSILPLGYSQSGSDDFMPSGCVAEGKICRDCHGTDGLSGVQRLGGDGKIKVERWLNKTICETYRFLSTGFRHHI